MELRVIYLEHVRIYPSKFEHSHYYILPITHVIC